MAALTPSFISQYEWLSIAELLHNSVSLKFAKCTICDPIIMLTDINCARRICYSELPAIRIREGAQNRLFYGILRLFS